MRQTEIAELVGNTIVEVVGLNKGSECVRFKLKDGRTVEMCHEQNCCEQVLLEDIVGDTECLLKGPVVLAEDASSREGSPLDGYCRDSHTWTFYTIGTAAGCVVLRWYGASNGYYSEEVSVFVSEAEVPVDETPLTEEEQKWMRERPRFVTIELVQVKSDVLGRMNNYCNRNGIDGDEYLAQAISTMEALERKS